MNRRPTGHWVPTTVAAEWLGESHALVRLFAFHCRLEGKLPEAVHHDKAMHPATALNTEHTRPTPLGADVATDPGGGRRAALSQASTPSWSRWPRGLSHARTQPHRSHERPARAQVQQNTEQVNPKEFNTSMATTTKKTENKTYAELISAADLAAIERAADARAALVELKDRIEGFVEDAIETAGRVSWIEGRFKAADNSVSAEDYALALATAKRAILLAGETNTGEFAGEKRVQQVQRSLPAGEKKLARAVAEALKGVLRGIDVHAVIGRAPEPTEAHVPLCVVSQLKPTTDPQKMQTGAGGYARVGRGRLAIAGEVEVTLFKLPVHRDLDGNRIADALAQHNIRPQYETGLRQQTPGALGRGDYEVQTIRLTIASSIDPDATPEELAEADAEMRKGRGLTEAARENHDSMGQDANKVWARAYDRTR